MTSPGKHHFLVTESDVLLESPILAVRRDVLVMPGGGTAQREIVEHFGATAIVAFDGENIALVRQYRHSVKDRLWELPAGLLDIADEDPLVGAQRELKEEAGLEAAQWSLLVDLVTSPGFCEEACRVYLARDLTCVERPPVNDDEEADMALEWFPVEIAMNMVFSGRIVNSIALAGILTASAVLSGRTAARSTEEPFTYRPTSLPERRKAEGIVPDMKKL